MVFEAPLADLLRLRTPFVGLIDPDERWRDALIGEALEQAGSSVRRVLTWGLTHGWEGSTDIIHKAGLTKRSSGKKALEIAPATHLIDLVDWLEVSGAAKGEEAGFAESVLVLRDLEAFLDDPGLRRVLIDLSQAMRQHGATAVLSLSSDLPPSDSLASHLVQLQADRSPHRRYGDMAVAFAQRYRPDTADEEVPGVLDALAGLSLTDAETVLRIVALDLVRRNSASGVPLGDEVREVREGR